MLLRDLRRRARKYSFQSLTLCLVLYFLFHLIQGARGIVTLRSLETALETSKKNLTTLKGKHAQLGHRVSLMKPGAVCPDILEEQVKSVLGYTRKGEKIVVQPKKKTLLP